MRARHELRNAPEGLAQEALHVVALDSATHAAADRDAETHLGGTVTLRPVLAARKRVQHEVAARHRAALAVDALEIGASRQARAPPGRSSGAIHRPGPAIP